MDVPLLITLVEGFPNLYDKQRKDFRDRTKRNNSWVPIGDVLGQSVEECQRVWRNLRERYVRERKTENPPSGAEQVENTWTYFHNMRFLKKHIISRKTCTNIKQSAMTKKDDRSQKRTWESLSETLVEPEDDEIVETQAEHASEITSEGENGRESRNSTRELRQDPAREMSAEEETPIAKPLHVKRKRSSDLQIMAVLTEMADDS